MTPERVHRLRPGGTLEIFLAFLRLGCTSFGGPIAHLGYFRTEFVERRRWIDDRGYSELVALCQFLPGPASSQVGMALGLLRAGWRGALGAWLGFTLPSAILLVLFAYGLTRHAHIAGSGAVHGLQVAAVAVVAQAVWAMARALCTDAPRVALALLAALLALALPSASAQVGAILVCGLAGRFLLRTPPVPDAAPLELRISRRSGVAALGVFTLILVVLPIIAAVVGSPFWRLIDGFYRAGALVFGGGHVVLPLLHAVVVADGFVTDAQFLAGYGAAQAVPGPLFTFAAYLGAVMNGPVTGWVGAAVFLVALFLPAFLLVAGALPFWNSLRSRKAIRATLAGVNAGVVGILLAALYDPVWTGAIRDRADIALALAAFGLLVSGRVSPFAVVALAALAGWGLAA